MLEINENICQLREYEITIKNIFNQIFSSDSNIIYIYDQERFLGVITSGDFMRRLKSGEKIYINRKYSAVMLKEETDILAEAEQLFSRWHITTAIPVIDGSGKVCCEVRKRREDKKKSTLFNFYEKFARYEKSNYLKEEIKYLKHLLENQDITVIGTKEQFLSVFKGLFGTEGRITFIDELDDAYEYFYNNEDLLIDVSDRAQYGRRDIYRLCHNGYRWESFLEKIIYVVENEHCSRFYRLADNEIVTIKEWLRKFSDGKLSFSANGILTAVLKEYLRTNGFEIEQHYGIYRGEGTFCFHLKANGIISKNCEWNEFNLLIFIDIILQFYYLNQEFVHQIPILNFTFDIEVDATQREKERMTKGGYTFSKYISKLEKEADNLYIMGHSSLEYLAELEKESSFGQIRNFENSRIVFKEHKSRLVNIRNGIRRTCYQPETYEGTVFIFGVCTIYGEGVEDACTIPSIIQKYINESGKKYRVINLGNGRPIDCFRLKKTLNIGRNDVMIFLFPFITEGIERLISVIEIGERFNQLKQKIFQTKDCFVDMVLHCGDKGNIIYSEIIFSELNQHLVYTNKNSLQKNNIYNIFKKDENDLDALYDWNKYVTELRREKYCLQGLKESTKIGCIVMNCNPFTLGHRYLVEYALEHVDYLYLFIVEEDKSYFSFTDRYQMVEAGVQDLENLSVIRSGRFMISAKTFPAYFKKESINEAENISVSEDLRIFAQYIAPVLDIQYRFVGEEPEDGVTGQYNLEMKEILPLFGISVVEIPRKCVENEIVSASTVRRYYQEKDFSSMKKLVPKEVFDCLTEMRNRV